MYIYIYIYIYRGRLRGGHVQRELHRAGEAHGHSEPPKRVVSHPDPRLSYGRPGQPRGMSN